MIVGKGIKKNYIDSKRKIKVAALKGFSLSIDKPGIYGILGSNGAGKTTLIKILMGLISLDEGEVKVLNYKPYNRDYDFLQKIGFVSAQKSVLDPHIPLETTLTLVGTIYGISEKDLKQRIYNLADQLKVTHRLQAPLRNLSLGERMKAEIIGSLFHSPKVLFLDEPTIGLDFESQIAIRSLIKSEQKVNNSFVLLTSHSIQDIKNLCEKIIILDKGEKIYDGTIANITLHKNPHKFIQLLIKELNT